MIKKIPTESIVYDERHGGKQRPDRSIDEAITNMISLAKEQGRNVAFSFADIHFEVTPKMTFEQGKSAWTTAYNQARRAGQNSVNNRVGDLDAAIIEAEPFDVFGHTRYFDQIKRFYANHRFGQIPEFMAYWGKLMQLRMRKQPLTEELILQTKTQATFKTGVYPTKPIMDLMSAVWIHGQKMAELLGQDGAYCDLHRVIKSDRAMRFYEQYHQPQASSLNSTQEAGRILAEVLQNPKRVGGYLKTLADVKLSAGELLQVRIPVLKLPMMDRQHVQDWKQFYKDVYGAAKQHLAVQITKQKETKTGTI